MDMLILNHFALIPKLIYLVISNSLLLHYIHPYPYQLNSILKLIYYFNKIGQNFYILIQLRHFLLIT